MYYLYNIETKRFAYITDNGFNLPVEGFDEATQYHDLNSARLRCGKLTGNVWTIVRIEFV